jgi:CRISPR-associated protein Csx10
MMKKIRIIFTLRTSLCIGGSSSSPIFDKATARNEEEEPIIPASAIKGALRIQFERLFDEDKLFSSSIFGSEGNESKLRFSNASLVGEERKFFRRKRKIQKIPGYSIKPGVTISRKLKTAKDESLFHFETTSPFIKNLKFEADVEGIDKLSIAEKEILVNFFKTLRNIDISIGGQKSRGLGHFLFDFKEIENEKFINSCNITSNEVKVILKPKEEIRVSFLKPKEYIYETLPYIPGSVIRGAFALKLKEKLPQAEFENIFLKSPLTFSNLYFSWDNNFSYPLPFSARQCKAFPGLNLDLSTTDKLKAKHGIKDILIENFILLKLQENGISLPIKNICQYCGENLESVEGYYYWDGDKPQKVEYPIHFSTKLEVDRKTSSAREKRLYSYETLDKSSLKVVPMEKEYCFTGTISNIDNSFRERLFSIQEIIIGGSKSKGLGKIEIKFSSFQKDSLETRMKNFQEKLKTFTEQIIKDLKLDEKILTIFDFENKLYFSIDFISDLILPLDCKNLTALLEKEFQNEKIIIERGFVKRGRAGGFNISIGIQKELTEVIAKGSAILLSLDGLKEDGIINKLENLERQGLGIKKMEGYGQVKISDKFHLIFNQI